MGFIWEKMQQIHHGGNILNVFSISRNSTEMHYSLLPSVSGSNETVVLLHGNGLHSGSWHKIADGLREHFQLLMYDFPGEGQSPMKATLPTWEELAEDLKLLLDELGIESCHLIGHGAGGNLAIVFTNEYPRCVKTACLISTPCYFSRTMYKNYIAYRKSLVSAGGFENLIGYLVPRITVSREGSPDWEMLWDGYRRTNPDMHFHFYEMVMDVNWIEKVRTIDKPVLLLSGTLDPILPSSSSAIIGSFIPRSRCVNIPNASNAVFIDNPQATLDAWLEFARHSDEPAKNDPFLAEYHRQIRKALNRVLDASGDGLTAEPRLAVNVLDGFSVSVNGIPLDKGWNRRYAKNLLLYLAVHGKVARERVIETFWPEMALDNARNQLRVALSHLRNLLGECGADDLIAADREYISLNGPVRCDLAELLAALRDGAENRPLLDRYAGIVLNEQYMSGFYDNWSVSIKQFIANMFERHYPELFGTD
jgi:pimeloyl-ACP methyl ester carboxylesterase